MAAVVFRLADERMDHAKRPEYALLASWAGSQVIMASSVALSGGPHVPTMAWFAIPLMTLGARFSGRGIAVGVALSILLLLAVGFGVDAQAVIDNPTLVVAPIALMITVAMFQTVLMRSDLKHRAEAVIDPLTGMLNRNALARRAQELAQQSLVTRQPVGLVTGDIDHFKRSTTPTAMPPGTPSSPTSPTACARRCAPSTSSTAAAARSSSCCCRAPTSRTRPSWPRRCAPPSRTRPSAATT
jgi:hypothetical protein